MWFHGELQSKLISYVIVLNTIKTVNGSSVSFFVLYFCNFNVVFLSIWKIRNTQTTCVCRSFPFVANHLMESYGLDWFGSVWIGSRYSASETSDIYPTKWYCNIIIRLWEHFMLVALLMPLKIDRTE